MVRADGTYEDDSSAGKRQRIEVQGQFAEEYQAVIRRWATVWDEGPIFEDKPLWVEQFEGPEGVRCARLLADKYFQSYLLREALSKGEETPCQLCLSPFGSGQDEKGREVTRRGLLLKRTADDPLKQDVSMSKDFLLVCSVC
jgi:hypothetical protein